ncbi:unnamed protein product [Brassicogethes aeneus]|uniref:DUF4371 domain-containing protein n=1 Tax=Brassicogethes aeneus TaxID=1431903 RepID=A0A9P0AY74_BRAAE|nr:unnamed protein product [Brassicogethes aeneus]
MNFEDVALLHVIDDVADAEEQVDPRQNPFLLSDDKFIKKRHRQSDSEDDNSFSSDKQENVVISEEEGDSIGPENADSSYESESTDTEAVTKNLRSRVPTKRRGVKNKFVQKICEKWKTEFKWLVYKENQSFCIYCKRIILGSFTHMIRHEKTVRHKNKMKSLRKIVDIRQFQTAIDEKKIFTLKVKECELKLLALIVEHNLPMLIMDHLPQLLVSAVPDSKILKAVHCSRTKTTASLQMFKDESEKCISDILKITKFSLIVDETTDIAVKKCLAIVVRYVDMNLLKVRDRLLSLVEVSESNAEGIIKEILKVITNLSIPVKNLIGFGADNVNVMMGKYNGVQAKLKEINNDIFVMGCICHSLHLAASAAAKKLPNAVEDFVRDIYNYLSGSSKRLKEFKEFQDFVNCKPHKILKPSQTRWLSLEMVVKRTLEQWNALQLFFNSAVLEDNLDAAKSIFDKLHNIFFKLYLSFLGYILPMINKMNLEFQSETPKLYTVYTRLETISKTILKNFMKSD